MGSQERRAYTALWVLALAFGWIEASVVVYLREIVPPGDAQVTLVSLPRHLLTVETAREACTILLLGAVAWLAGRRLADRIGAFLLAFGVWDLSYYAGLKLALGWPETLGAWDILFLIPRPWVAPVWAPVVASILFVAGGTYLFSTSARERRYGWLDVAVLLASVLLALAAFLSESSAVIDHRVPERFAVWLFAAGAILGTAWFIRVERRVAAKGRASAPAGVDRSEATAASGAVSGDGEGTDVGDLVSEYTAAKRQLDALVNEAGALGERFERIGHALSVHPKRLMIGPPGRVIEDPMAWDVMPDRALPPIENLVTLTEGIRQAALRVEDLRERLVLMGRADVPEQLDEFFR